jgi:hypothetical protein
LWKFNEAVVELVNRKGLSGGGEEDTDGRHTHEDAIEGTPAQEKIISTMEKSMIDGHHRQHHTNAHVWSHLLLWQKVSWIKAS